MTFLGRVFRHYFDLNRDKDDEADIIASITRGISFKGTNLWTLIFAVIIASVGLNVNSTAVIIGAMLISPLMGPIMGVGLGLAIADFDLVRRGAKNLAIAVVFSIATSTLYFYLTPLHNPTSELLARTTPTLWDVFIAFAGGLAGIVGATRKEKGNVIPGVAIATALMPPLCTVGYGLATAHWYFALGALYLFFINSVFICTATVLVVRFMNLHRHEFESEAHRRRVTRYIVLIVLLTAAPSVWLAYRIVRKAVFENAAQRFVRIEMDLPNTQVVSKNFVFDRKQPKIEVLLFGQTLDSLKLDSLQRRLPEYGLDSVRLVVRQGLNAQQQIDFAQIRAAILDETLQEDDTGRLITASRQAPASLPDLGAELNALSPQIESYSLYRTTVVAMDSSRRSDSVLMFIGNSRTAISPAEQQRIGRWLNARFAADSVQTVFLRLPPPAGSASPAARPSGPARRSRTRR